jgi:hypothetical protein
MLIILQALYALFRVFIFNFFTRIWTFLLFALPWLIEKSLKLLAIGFVSYQGFDFLLDRLSSFIFSKFDNLFTDLYSILVILKVDAGIAMLFSAMSIALTIKIATQGSKMIFKSKGSLEA